MKRTPLKRRTPMPPRSSPLPKEGTSKPKRQARYKAYLASAEWKRKRMERFTLDGFRCVRIKTRIVNGFSDVGDRLIHRAESYRCPNQDVTRTGRGLRCNHKSYARFGNELMEDLETLCEHCDTAYEAEKRPWNRNRKRAS